MLSKETSADCFDAQGSFFHFEERPTEGSHRRYGTNILHLFVYYGIAGSQSYNTNYFKDAHRNRVFKFPYAFKKQC